MFSIDLLQGKGKTSRCGFKTAVLKAVPILIPLIAIAAWAASFQQDGATIRTQKAEIRKNQAVIDDSGQSVESFYKVNRQVNQMKTSLETITEGLSYRIQVTDMLLEMTRSLPDGIFFYEIDLDRTESWKKVPQPQGKKDKQRLVVQRKLKLTVCGFDPAESDRLVREYVNHLKTSEALAETFVDVKPAARRQGLVEEKPATYYEIECVLREQG